MTDHEQLNTLQILNIRPSSMFSLTAILSRRRTRHLDAQWQFRTGLLYAFLILHAEDYTILTLNPDRF